MNRTCIVVADARQAHFYGVEAVDSPRLNLKLVERTALTNPNFDLRKLGESTTGRARSETNSNRQSGPMHPMEAQRERHRDEFDRRFVHDISLEAGEITRGWKTGTFVLVADPRMLGLMREPLRKAVPRGIDLKELAKDYAQLTVPELRDQLVSSGVIPPQRASAQ